MTTSETVMPPADLASAFGAPDRAAGLQGLSRRQVTAAPPASTPVPTATNTRADKNTATTPAQAPRRSTPATQQNHDTPQRSVTVYVARNLRTEVIQERNRATAAGELKTNAGIVLHAVENALPLIDQLVNAGEQPIRAGLFTHRDRAIKEPGVQLGMRLSEADLATLDQIAEEHCDGNRSQLIEHALAHRYQPEPPTRT
jgi:hypothetical protein